MADPETSPNQDDDQPKGQTMQDESIVERLQENPEDADAQLDAALDASMDGSDPVSISQPARSAEPPPADGQHGDVAPETQRSR